MAFMTINFEGQALGKYTDLNVIVPESGAGPFPVLYLLHGFFGDYTSWQRNLPIVSMVECLPLIVVMPDGGRGFYCDNPSPGGLRYAGHIVEDVVGEIDRVFPTVASREGRVIAGYSMGGYGAVMLSLKYPGVFRGASSHSGAFTFAHEVGPLDDDYIHAFWAALPTGVFDLFELAKTAGRTAAESSAAPLPAIRMDCGADDPLLDINRDFAQHLTSLGIDHDYAEEPGDHSWDYWRAQFPRTLEFAKRVLGIE